MPGRDAFETLVLDADGALVAWRGAILLQTRSGALNPRLLAAGQAFLAKAERVGRPIGMLAVLEEGAPLPSTELRHQQRQAIESWGHYDRGRVAAAILGADMSASLVRSSGRLLGIGNPRIERFEQVRPAVSWLAQELTSLALAHPDAGERVRPTELYDAIEQVRRMPAHRETP